MHRIERLRAGDPVAARRAVICGAVAVVVVGAAMAVYVHPLVGIAAVIVLGATPLLLRDIHLAFLAVVGVITLLPFAALPLGIGFNPTLLDVALGILYLIWIVRLATREQPRLRLPSGSAGVIGFIGLMVVAFLAGTAHGMPSKNVVRTFGELVLGAGLFVLIGNLVVDRAGLRRAYRALVGMGAASAGVGLALYVLPDALQVRLLSLLRVLDYPSGLAVMRYINDDPSRLQRAVGTAIDPNSFGGLLAVIAALIAPQLVTRAPLVTRRVAAAVVTVVVLALLATVSRGSLLGLGAALGVIGLARDRRMLALAVTVVVALLLLAQVLPWTAAYVDHFTQGLRVEDRATQMRAGEYRDALRLIGRYPVLGVGFGGPRDVDLYRGVSNLYLILAETMGLVGLGAFLAAMTVLVARMLAAWRRMADDGLRALVLGCVAALAAALTSGAFDHYFFTYPHAFALLWLVAGLGMSAVALAQAER